MGEEGLGVLQHRAVQSGLFGAMPLVTDLGACGPAQPRRRRSGFDLGIDAFILQELIKVLADECGTRFFPGFHLPISLRHSGHSAIEGLI